MQICGGNPANIFMQIIGELAFNFFHTPSWGPREGGGGCKQASAITNLAAKSCYVRRPSIFLDWHDGNRLFVQFSAVKLLSAVFIMLFPDI